MEAAGWGIGWSIGWIQVLVLAIVQGAAELLPVSSSAHVIVAEKLMGLDPSSPQMTFLLVMLHTGTMFAVLLYFGRRWIEILRTDFMGFAKQIAIATAATGVLGLTLKKLLEVAIGLYVGGGAPGDIRDLFKSLPLVGLALAGAGLIIVLAARRTSGASDWKVESRSSLTPRRSLGIGLVQGICLPFRGFSRSGATISTGMILGVPRQLAEEFSFALAVVLTPPVILQELHHLHKTTGRLDPAAILPGLLGMFFAFAAGLLALRWLSAWLERGKWKLFGYYCFGFSAVVFWLAWLGY
jgi:undecaprenyl-diphosphatase